MVTALIGSLPAMSAAAGTASAKPAKGLFQDALQAAVAGTGQGSSASPAKSRDALRTATPWLGVAAGLAELPIQAKAALAQGTHSAEPLGRAAAATSLAPGLPKSDKGAEPAVQASLADVRASLSGTELVAMPAQAAAATTAQVAATGARASAQTAVHADLPAARTSPQSAEAVTAPAQGAATELLSSSQSRQATPATSEVPAASKGAARVTPAPVGVAERMVSALTGSATVTAAPEMRVMSAKGRTLATTAATAAGVSRQAAGVTKTQVPAAAARDLRTGPRPASASASPAEGGTQSLQHRDRPPAGVVAGGGETGRSVALGQAQPSVAMEARTGGAAGATQVDAGHVAAQVAAAAQRAAASMDAGTASVRLQLDPPQLGHVQVTLRAAQDGIVAVLRAESPAAVAVLQGGQEDLRQRLGALGFKASAVEVTAAERPRIVVASSRSSAGRRSG